MLLNSDIIADKEAQLDKLLWEGREDEVRDFIQETRLLAWELNELTYKFLFIYGKPYHPKHFK